MNGHDGDGGVVSSPTASYLNFTNNQHHHFNPNPNQNRPYQKNMTTTNPNDFNYKNFKQLNQMRKTSQNDELLLNNNINAINTNQIVKRKSLNFQAKSTTNKHIDTSMATTTTTMTTTTTPTPSSSSSFNSAVSNNINTNYNNGNSNNVIKFKHYFQKHLNQEYANSQQQMSYYKQQEQKQSRESQTASNNYDGVVKSKSKSNSLIGIKSAGFYFKIVCFYFQKNSFSCS